MGWARKSFWRLWLVGSWEGVVFIWHLGLGAVRACYWWVQKRVCARGDFGVGVEVVVGEGVGAIFWGADFLLGAIHRAHGDARSRR